MKEESLEEYSREQILWGERMSGVCVCVRKVD